MAVVLDTLSWRGNRPVAENWTRMFRPNWEAIAIDGSLSRTDLRVLLLCSAFAAGDDNRVLLSQTEIAEKLGVSLPHISRTVRRFREAGVIFQKGRRLYLNSRLATDAQRVLDLARLRREEAKTLKDMGLLED